MNPELTIQPNIFYPDFGSQRSRTSAVNDSDTGYAIPSVKIVCDKAEELSQLEDNWDGYGAVKPSYNACMGVVRWAFDLFLEHTPPPSVIPSPNGSIQMEWSCYGLNLEIEVISISTCKVFYENLDSGECFEREFTSNIVDLVQAISLLSSLHQNRAHPRVNVA